MSQTASNQILVEVVDSTPKLLAAYKIQVDAETDVSTSTLRGSFIVLQKQIVDDTKLLAVGYPDTLDLKHGFRYPCTTLKELAAAFNASVVIYTRQEGTNTLEPDTPAIVNENSLPPARVGTAYSQKFIAILADFIGSIAYTVVGSLPPGLSLSGSTVSGTPTQRGNYSFGINADSTPLVGLLGDTTSSSTTVTVSSTASLTVGMSVTGSGISVGATIASITNGTTLVLSAAATATATGVSLSFADSGGDTTKMFYLEIN